jgi:phosphodiesterase/alkaline phosphatase D-like protein
MTTPRLVAALACTLAFLLPPPGAAAPLGPVLWVWSGGVTPRSAVIKARLRAGVEGAYLLIGERPDLSDAKRVEPEGPVPAHRIATFRVGGLTPDRPYAYAVSTASSRDPRPASFRTFPEGPASFTFAFGSCASTGSRSVLFDTVRRKVPLFLLHMGDFHYRNIRRNEPERFHAAFDAVLASPAQAALYRSTSIVYVWDDHDYGPDDSDRTSPARAAAQTVYRAAVPHFPLELGSAEIGRISQAFTVGRVRVIVTDTRSERAPKFDPDTDDKTMLGADQLAWLEGELAAAAKAHPLVIWVSTVPWITKVDARLGHGWEPYHRERTRLADTIKRLGLVSRLIMVSGDAHMAAIDDGTNSNYASDARPGERGFVVVHAAPFDRWPRRKGGPYSHGRSSQRNQFGWASIRDEGGNIDVELSGHFRDGSLIPGLRLVLRCVAEGCAPLPRSP